MTNLLDLLHERGFHPRKTSFTYGGEWVSPCPGPVCGGAGDDRFHVWPFRESGGRVPGRFWCRQCGISGDTIAFLEQVDGLSFVAACRALGIPLESRSPAKPSRYQPPPTPVQEQGPVWQPHAYPDPSSLWQEKAAALLADCQARLHATPEALAWLAARGIDAAMARTYGLGYNLSRRGTDRYRPRASWGLPEKTQGGRQKRLWLPAGWVIPAYNEEGRLVQLRIRRRPADIDAFAHGIKYLPVDGSSMASFILHPEAEVFVVVEGGFDAVLLAGITDGRIGAITTWNSSARPDARAHEILRRSSLILGGLDYDQGGDREQKWWQAQYPQYRRLPALPQGLKDPGDAAQAGIDLAAWLMSGLPRGLQIKLGLESGRPRIQQPHPIEAPSTELPPTEARPTDEERVIELDLLSGKTVYVTDSRAAWAELAEQGKPVFSRRELLRLQQALAGLDEAERATAIQRTIEAKEVFGGYIVRGRTQEEEVCE